MTLHGRAVPKSFLIHPELSHVFPTAKQLASASSIGLAMPAARLTALKSVAEASLADPNLFRPFGSIEETVTRLRTIRGIGEWTAQYIALRAIREMDAFPATDIGLLRSATSTNGKKVTPANLLNRAESWRPWRAYAPSIFGLPPKRYRRAQAPQPNRQTSNRKDQTMSRLQMIDSRWEGWLIAKQGHRHIGGKGQSSRVRLGDLVADEQHPILMEPSSSLNTCRKTKIVSVALV